MNFPLPSARKIFIKKLDFASTQGNHVWKTSTKSSFLCKYKVQVFGMCSHIRMAAQMLFNCNFMSCGPQRLACTFFSLLNVAIMLLFRLTTLVNLLLIYDIHNLSRISGSSNFVCQTTVTGVTFMPDGIVNGFLKSDASDVFELFKLIKIFARLYFLLSSCPSWIPFLSFEALITQLLPICASRQCHRQIHLFQLTK